MLARAAALPVILFLLCVAFTFRHGFAQVPDGISEIDKIFAEDQQVREPPDPHAPKIVYGSDEQRETAVRRLLAGGNIQTGRQFEEAAFIFQHSRNPDDYLLSHTLAMIAVSKGDEGALWIASASLDRYLMAIGKPQIYGTQFMLPKGEPVSQEPYNHKLISDALRQQLGIPPLAAQQLEIERLTSGRRK